MKGAIRLAVYDDASWAEIGDERLVCAEAVRPHRRPVLADAQLLPLPQQPAHRSDDVVAQRVHVLGATDEERRRLRFQAAHRPRLQNVRHLHVQRNARQVGEEVEARERKDAVPAARQQLS
jgi:hypothetical protein